MEKGKYTLKKRDGPIKEVPLEFKKGRFDKVKGSDKIRYRLDDDGLSEYIRVRKDKGSKLSAKELKQKAYFDSRLTEDKKDEKPQEKVVNITSKRKQKDQVRINKEPAKYAAFTALKYHIDSVRDYGHEDEEDKPKSIEAAKYSQVSSSSKYRADKERRYKKADPEIIRQDEISIKRFKERKDTIFKEKRSEIKEKALERLKEFVRRNKTIIIAASIIVVSIVSVAGVIGTGIESMSEGFKQILIGISPTGDIEMADTDNYFQGLEADLQYIADHLEEVYPGYDVYETDIDDIGHDSFLLMSYLSAVYNGYDLNTTKDALDAVFNDVYEVKYISSTEGSGKNKIKKLKMTVRKKDLNTVLTSRMSDDEKALFDTYNDTSGGHQVYANPVPGNWSGKISSPFGWRIHPISGKEKFHKGVDIALPTGTPVRSVSEGKVIKSYYSQSAGNYIVIEDKLGNQIHYMHLSERSVNVGDSVDKTTLIGKVGSTGNSTGPHLHLGISDKDGNYLNPVFLVDGGD